MFKKLPPAALFLFTAIFFLVPAASAEEQNIRNGFWGGIDAGAGLLKQSFDEGDEKGTFSF